MINQGYPNNILLRDIKYKLVINEGVNNAVQYAVAIKPVTYIFTIVFSERAVLEIDSEGGNEWPRYRQ